MQIRSLHTDGLILEITLLVLNVTAVMAQVSHVNSVFPKCGQSNLGCCIFVLFRRAASFNMQGLLVLTLGSLT